MEQKDVLKALQRDHAAELKLAAERLKGTARHTEIIPPFAGIERDDRS